MHFVADIWYSHDPQMPDGLEGENPPPDAPETQPSPEWAGSTEKATSWNQV